MIDPQARARATYEIFDGRPLETYLDGRYAARMARGESLEIPASRHILLAACERVQKAWEGEDNCGVFSRTLLDVLGQSGADPVTVGLQPRAVENQQENNEYVPSRPTTETAVAFGWEGLPHTSPCVSGWSVRLRALFFSSGLKPETISRQVPLGRANIPMTFNGSAVCFPLCGSDAPSLG